MYVIKRIIEIGKIPEVFKSMNLEEEHYEVETMLRCNDFSVAVSEMHTFADEIKDKIIALDGFRDDKLTVRPMDLYDFEMMFDITDKIAEMLGLITDEGINIKYDGDNYDEYVDITYYLMRESA